MAENETLNPDEWKSAMTSHRMEYNYWMKLGQKTNSTVRYLIIIQFKKDPKHYHFMIRIPGKSLSKHPIEELFETLGTFDSLHAAAAAYKLYEASHG
jgi:hypothetical protein